ncbi:MAG: toprim domain-containing protein [Alphaproteobacteria bacterium]|nr:toprim domain-containing protein [Alphaproteobacteria bacterium]NCQ66479.1 toprim domain-containing protein [Alphaproteobacteria bacterium]
MFNEFKKAMSTKGLQCPIDIVTDGKVHRFSSNGGRNKDGWYVLYENTKGSYGGVYGDWKTGKSYKWSSIKGTASPQQQQEIDFRIEAAKKLHKKETTDRQDKAFLEASNLWKGLNENGTSPYLQKKQVQAYGVRFGNIKSLVVPLCDISGKLWSLQTIASTGDKKFLSGGKKKGCFHTLGVLDTSSQVYVCEGYATAASLYEATRVTTVVAFDAGNLEPVVKAIRHKYPDLSITVAADNDQWKEVNTGLVAARAVAKKHSAQVIYPDFSDAIRGESKPTDFNDLHVLGGLYAVRKQVLKGGAQS